MKDDNDDIKDFDFDTWFDLFSDRVRKLGYNGPIDKGSFELIWEDNQIPERAAMDFFIEMSA